MGAVVGPRCAVRERRPLPSTAGLERQRPSIDGVVVVLSLGRVVRPQPGSGVDELFVQPWVSAPDVHPHGEGGDDVADHHLVPGEGAECGGVLEESDEAVEADLEGREQHDEAQ